MAEGMVSDGEGVVGVMGDPVGNTAVGRRSKSLFG